MATIGEQFLLELGKQQMRYGLFDNYGTYQTIKRIDRLTELHEFLCNHRFGPIGKHDNLPDMADDFIAAAKAKIAEEAAESMKRGVAVQAFNMAINPLFWPLAPIALPIVCLMNARDEHGRIQFRLIEFMGLAVVVAIAVQYQLFYMPPIKTIPNVPMSWSHVFFTHAVPCSLIGLACGAVCRAIFQRKMWLWLSLMVFAEIEVVALLIAYLRS